jgi:hypothetical protein
MNWMFATTEDFHRYLAIMAAPYVSNEAKCAKFIDQVEDYLGASWLLCVQLVAILECFGIGTCGRTKVFGSYRVDLVVTFFPKLVDIYNFDIVLKHLQPSGEAISRRIIHSCISIYLHCYIYTNAVYRHRV